MIQIYIYTSISLYDLFLAISFLFALMIDWITCLIPLEHEMMCFSSRFGRKYTIYVMYASKSAIWLHTVDGPNPISVQIKT
jgi:hypothetical protein